MWCRPRFHGGVGSHSVPSLVIKSPPSQAFGYCCRLLFACWLVTSHRLRWHGSVLLFSTRQFTLVCSLNGKTVFSQAGLGADSAQVARHDSLAGGGCGRKCTSSHPPVSQALPSHTLHFIPSRCILGVHPQRRSPAGGCWEIISLLLCCPGFRREWGGLAIGLGPSRLCVLSLVLSTAANAVVLPPSAHTVKP
jgi:hypothetical protein